MTDHSVFEQLKRTFLEEVPNSVQQAKEELNTLFDAFLKESISSLSLADQEQFAVAQKVLLRTREKLEALEEKVRQLESSQATK